VAVLSDHANRQPAPSDDIALDLLGREVNEKVSVRESQVVKWGREGKEQQVARKVDIRI